MKLQKEFEYVKTQFENNLVKIKYYAQDLKASGNYKDFEVRLCWDCLRAFVGSGTICLWYDKYNCNDKHVTTLGKKALKELGVI